MVKKFEYGLNAQAKEFDGLNKYLRITDINDLSRKFEKNNLTSPDIEVDRNDQYLLQDRDIVFARTGASVGKTYLYDESDGKTYFAGFLIRGTISNSNDKNFIFQATLTKKYFRFVDITSQRSGQPGINAKEYSNYSFLVPNKAEQSKIGNLLNRIDLTIDLHQRKLELLQKNKKFLLQKMFPKNREKNPEIRFSEFNNDWEQKKLKNIGNTFTGLSGKAKEDFGHGDAEYITYMNVFSNPISNLTGTDKIEIDKKQNEVKYGDVLFTTSSETPEEVGMSSVWLGNSSNVYLNSFCFGFRPTKKIDPYYLGYLLRSQTVRRKIMVLGQGISRYNISKNKLVDISITVPSYEEQQKIGMFLNNQDMRITDQIQNIKRLKLLKKHLLNKLFI